ncbi:nucleotidyltransferase domain-containing protein [Candidatus Woesearchaeota archaeon]|nr:nucleotidyltransferase domain-containing protein [Candidatus Woesearchaeota archaeon]
MGARENKIIKQLSLFKKRIKKKYDVKKILLFGSLARGEFTKQSDIDLIVISDSFRNKKSFQRSPKIHMEWDLDYPVDFICLTKKEFEKKKQTIAFSTTILKDIIEIK